MVGLKALPDSISLPLSTALKPKEVVEQLNKFIVGQPDAKRAVAIALRNRWRRFRLTPDLKNEVFHWNEGIFSVKYFLQHACIYLLVTYFRSYGSAKKLTELYNFNVRLSPKISWWSAPPAAARYRTGCTLCSWSWSSIIHFTSIHTTIHTYCTHTYTVRISACVIIERLENFYICMYVIRCQ